jgi:hypothetical protein
MQPNASREILSPVDPMLMYSIASPALVIQNAKATTRFYNARLFRAADWMHKCRSIGYNAAP